MLGYISEAHYLLTSQQLSGHGHLDSDYVPQYLCDANRWFYLICVLDETRDHTINMFHM